MIRCRMNKEGLDLTDTDVYKNIEDDSHSVGTAALSRGTSRAGTARRGGLCRYRRQTQVGHSRKEQKVL